MSFTNAARCIALVDCNNFFVSCERLFAPRLHHRPVVVLSNNDGVIISRSQEAKKLGIPMGAPHFEWASFLERNHVEVFSSNFALYGDMSGRVMATLACFSPEFEIYSIDEAFLFLQVKDPQAFCALIRKEVLKRTGIPVSIGISTTKTLAKVANKKAKKEGKGVYALLEEEEQKNVLRELSPQEVWGIGKRMNLSLEKKGIRTALQFSQKEDLWIRQHFSVTGLKVAWELRGIPCFSQEETPQPKKSILTSRSFGRPILSKEELLQAVSHFATHCGESLREEGSLAYLLQVFVEARSKEGSFLGHQATITFPEPTSYTPTLIEGAQEGIQKIFRPGLAYKRAGVLLSGIVSAQGGEQSDLFMPQDAEKREKERKAMEILDQINERWGERVVQFASSNFSNKRREHCSPAYTTKWEDVLTIQI